MDLKKIKEIIDLPLTSDKDKESLIIDELSKSENILNILLMILDSERIRKSELVDNINLLLSKADACLQEPKLNKSGFMQTEIAEFYKNSEINHCFIKAKK